MPDPMTQPAQEQEGRRVPDGAFFDDPQPGDYGKVFSDGEIRWFNWPPSAPYPGVLRNFEVPGKPFHDVEEHDDGTITVRPSILVKGSVAVGDPAGPTDGPIFDSFSGWHGFLERGVWRDA